MAVPRVQGAAGSKRTPPAGTGTVPWGKSVSVKMPVSKAQPTALRKSGFMVTSTAAMLASVSGDPAARQRKVRICPWVHRASGEKVVAVVPVVMPFSTAQAMGAA